MFIPENKYLKSELLFNTHNLPNFSKCVTVWITWLKFIYFSIIYLTNKKKFNYSSPESQKTKKQKS